MSLLKDQLKLVYIPIYYVPQVQLNLYICDLQIADFIEYNPKTQEINIVRIVRDNEWLKLNIPILKDFWNTVEHYRNIGIEKHPSYEKRIKREEKRLEQKRKKIEQEQEPTSDDNVLEEIRKKGCLL